MKLARTLQLPTGMAMTFVCSPPRATDAAQDSERPAITEKAASLELAAQDWDELKRRS